MKVRNKDLCDTCRKRKLQCDGKRPACTQCVCSNRTCEGYPDALFVPFVATKTALRSMTTRPKRVSRTTQSGSASEECHSVAESGSKESPILSRKTTSLPDSLSPLDQSPTQGLPTTKDKVALILRNFLPLHELEFASADASEQCSRFCGSWALALPRLTADMTGPFSQCLHSAVSALALSITAHQNRENLQDATVAQYGESLRLLGHSLAVAGDTCSIQIVAAVMCLALTEVLCPTDELSWLVHIEGVSKIVQLMQPERFATGIEHIMLMGFRPLLILKAFILRKATFFADESWITLPSTCHPAAPLQSLLVVAAHIPALLEKVDVVIPASCDAATGTADQLITELMESISRLKAWHTSFLANIPEPLYCSRNLDRDISGTFESLWYPSLGTANVFVYFWAFQLLCLNEIQHLLNRFPHLKHTVHNGAAYSEEAFRDECLDLSTYIYKSMEYLLRTDFMLYGIASAHFPLSIALKTLQLDAKGQAILKTLDNSIITKARM